MWCTSGLQLRWMLMPFVLWCRALASRHRAHPRAAQALSVPQPVTRGRLVAWACGLQAGRQVSAQWSTLAQRAILPLHQLLMLASFRVGKARAEAKEGLLLVEKMGTGVVWAGPAEALQRLQAWPLIWHLVRLWRPCPLGSSTFLLEQRRLLLPRL